MPAAPRSPRPFSLRSHPHLYQINTWSWLEQLSARLGKHITLADVPDSEYDALASLGFNIVWFMGVWQRSPMARRFAQDNRRTDREYDQVLPGWTPADVISSPYSVAAYVPDPRIGSWAALDLARKKLRARGMGLFLDFVGNHTGLDHPWINDHPEFYVLGSQQDFSQNPSLFYSHDTPQGPRFIAYGKDPYFPPWQDVAQLNHFNPGLRAAMIAVLREISAHCDGVRCDMAMLQLTDIFANVWGHLLGSTPRPATEFWTDAHAAVPKLVLLAEAYWGTELRLLDLGFSYSYDKTLYDAVRYINIPDARNRITSLPEHQSDFARFMENHDEPRRPEIFPNDRLLADGTFFGTLPGLRFYHQGELEGRRIRLPITLRVAADEPPDPFSQAFFQKILQITRQDVFHDGKWDLLEILPQGDPSPDGLLAYEWRSPEAWKVIVVNLAGDTSQGRVHLADRVSAARQYLFNDELNGVTYPRAGDELHNLGLFVRLDAFQAHIFDVTLAP
ncbi:MAG: alpha-amylase family glycosyl hydrolase [Candidatus Acidiferrales bacterium]